jgi:hypothetical protein
MSKNKDFKKDFKLVFKKSTAMAIALSFLLAAGCNKKIVESTSESTTNTTTIETTNETNETTAVVNNNVLKYEEEANKFYEENRDFFVKEYGTDKDLAVKDINNTILVITNDSETITNEDLGKTFDAMDRMFMPTDVRQNAGNYMTEEPLDDSEHLPNLSRYVQNDEAKDIINTNTIVINNLVDALNSGDLDKIAQARKDLLARVAYIEKEHDDLLKDLGEISDGDEYTLNLSFKGLVDLGGVLVLNGRLTYTYNGDEQTIALIPNAYEAAVLEAYRSGQENNVPYDTQFDTTTNTTINGRNVEYLGADGFEKDFVPVSEKERIEDTLAITKYKEAIYMLEGKFANISAEYYSLNSDCITKTLQ